MSKQSVQIVEGGETLECRIAARGAIPEAAIAMLACARIGAVHSVVFGGFSPDALKDRILDAEITTGLGSDDREPSGTTP